MKKMIIALLGVTLLAPLSFANEWGVGVKLGAGKNDPSTMQKMYNLMSGDKTFHKNAGVLGLELFYEQPIQEGADRLGIKLGFDIYGRNKIKYNSATATEDTYIAPVTVYYKRDNGVVAFSYYGGAGVSFLYSELEGGSDREHKYKTFAHLVAGAEYRFTQLFALGLEARFNIGAKAKKDDWVYSNRSGFGGAITGRFYF